MYHALFTHLVVEGDLGYFQFLLMTNKAASNFYVKAYVWKISFLCQEWDFWVVWSLCVYFIINCQTAFKRGCTVLHSYHNGRELQMVHILPRTRYCQEGWFFFSFFFFNVFTMFCFCFCFGWVFSIPHCVFAASISSVTNDVEYFFMFLFAISVSSLASAKLLHFLKKTGVYFYYYWVLRILYVV